MEFWPWQWCWWLVLSFEAPAMEVMGLIQRWRDQAGEERRAKGLKVSAEKKKKGDVASQDWLV